MTPIIPLQTACFTGHRIYHLGAKINENKEMFSAIISKLEELIVDTSTSLAIDTFISGMALGIDTYAARAVLNMRDYGMNIRLICAIPCTNQDARWSISQKKMYHEILDEADEVIYLGEEYTDGCMQRRNRFMVDSSSLVIAVWNGNPGGTASTVRYAEKRGVPVMRIDPKKLGIPENSI